ncbi:hypothetical protein [Micromonospora coerulea]|uniref:hypothetical protein n=1 Tax=Micromonospora coerulea TaxID=47856 RepID=UPI001F425E16|nr:hypothetical protein [Micromonospora veneta]
MTDPNGLIRPGRPAPGFTLPATPNGRQVGPEQFRGRPDPGLDAITLDTLDRRATDRRVVAG